MIFTHDLKFYTDATSKLNKVTVEMQMLNPKRQHIVVKQVISLIDVVLNALAKPYNNCGLAMGKTYFLKQVKPLIMMREIFVIIYHKLKPQEEFISAGTGSYERRPMMFDEVKDMPSDFVFNEITERRKFINDILKDKPIIISTGKGHWDLLNDFTKIKSSCQKPK